MTLAGSRIIIAGAGRGIGRAIALELARQGAHLVIGARTQAEIDAVAAECRERQTPADAIRVDVADASDVARFVDRASQILGRIDGLVSAAGIAGPIGPAEMTDVGLWASAIQVNLLGTYYLCRAVVPRMKKQRRGKIVMLGGGGAAAPMPFFSAYAASKAGLVRFADTLAAELADFNIQVNVIAPGLVDTAIHDDVLAAGAAAGPMLSRVERMRASGEGAVGADLAADLAAFLLSNDSGQLTGKLIAAPHDPWRQWASRADALNRSPLYTVRRVDAFTLAPYVKDLIDA
ncbi:MAG TPA: SDR family NAD(P)-dependent oxidoreductase [Vicinamibacterales bacterium]|nr:SDR family NAD(P)-dependent oxidoreductase [Vicinamibacterales bacterium]